jgi:hypothetical protein
MLLFTRPARPSTTHTTTRALNNRVSRHPKVSDDQPMMTSFTMTCSLRDELDQAAAQNGVSRSQFIRAAIAAALEDQAGKIDTPSNDRSAMV